MKWDRYAETYPQLDDAGVVPSLLASVMAGRRGAVLDVGCGEGELLTLLREAYGSDWTLTGFEVSPLRGKMARDRGHNVVIEENGVIPLEPGSFDLVISTHVIEHVPDDRAYAAELLRMARPGGLVYVETPVKLPGAWYFRRNPQAGWVLDPTHVREYRSPTAVNEVLQSVALDIIAEDLTPVAFPVAAAELLIRRLLRVSLPARTQISGFRAIEIPIPRYRQQAVLARRSP